MGMYRISIKGLVLNEEKHVLLLHEKNTVWDFPGGGLDYPESFTDCLRREFREELGIQSLSFLQPDPVLFTTSEFIYNQKPVHQLTVFYHVDIGQQQIIPGEDHMNYAYIDPEQLKTAGLESRFAPITGQIMDTIRMLSSAHKNIGL